MKAIMVLVILCIPLILFSNLSVNNAANFDINGIDLQILPQVSIKTALNTYHNITFTTNVTAYSDSFLIEYSANELDFELSLVPVSSFHSKSWQAVLKASYKADLQVQDLALNITFSYPSGISTYKGMKAINSHRLEDNINLCPYTDRAIEYHGPNSSFWIVGSNCSGCKGVESITENALKFYDHTLHFTRLSGYQTIVTDKVLDTLPVLSGGHQSWSFIIYEEKPFLVSISRWPAEKKAAFAITNDADGETTRKLTSAYYGSNNPTNASYLKKGLIVNHIKISNTVFGRNINAVGSIWTSLRTFGNTIGYHTYSDRADSSDIISNSLLNQMSTYNVRLWVDHSLPYNPEDFGCYGTFSSSPYYILNTINNSNIDYVWVGDTPQTNHFNAFDEPWRLPHQLPFITSLTKPIWFFGRTRMESWEYFDPDYNKFSMKYNLTTDNLDKLLINNGLCVGYAHFSFDNNSTRNSFFYVYPNDDCEIRDDFNEALKMLDTYQKERGLWIDTVENIFDRMRAIEKVEIESIDAVTNPGFIKLTVRNKSDLNLDDLTLSYGNESKTIASMPSQQLDYLLFATDNQPDSTTVQPPFVVIYVNESIYIKNRANDFSVPSMRVEIFNLKGQIVGKYNQQSQANSLIIPFSNKATGIYLAKIKPVNARSQLIKFSVIK